MKMFTKCAILLFELVSFFNTIEYATGQQFTVRVSFLSKDQDTTTFMTKLAPIFEALSACVAFDFHPLYNPMSFSGGQPSDLDKLYSCARYNYKLLGYKLAKFYVCMISGPGTEQLFKGPTCANKASIDWGKVNNCTPAELGTFDTGDHLEITFNNIHIPDITTRFREVVCTELDSFNVPCACCIH